MKKIILSLLACSTLLFSSCDQENVAAVLKPANPVASVVQPTRTVALVETLGGKLTLEVARSNRTGETPTNFRVLSVLEDGLNVTQRGIFTLASAQATFVEGSGYGTVQLNYDLNSLDPRFTYVITVQNVGLSDSPTQSKAVINAKRQLEYKQFAQGTVNSQWGIYDPTVEDWVSTGRVNVEKADGIEFYRVLNFWGPDTHVEFYVEGNNDVVVPKQENGEFDDRYGDIFVNSTTPPLKRIGNTFFLRLDISVTAGSYGTYTESLILD